MKRNLNRRVVLVIICCFSGILLFFNIFTSSMNGASLLQRKGKEENMTLDNVRAVKSISEPKDSVKLQTLETKLESSSVKTTNNNLPWYFKDGSILPSESNKTRKLFQNLFLSYKIFKLIGTRSERSIVLHIDSCVFGLEVISLLVC